MKAKKVKSPEIIVDLYDMEDPKEIAASFALAKHAAGKPLSDSDLMAIIDHVAEAVRPKITFVNMECDCKKCKKLPWYKRFWNWITRKK